MKHYLQNCSRLMQSKCFKINYYDFHLKVHYQKGKCTFYTRKLHSEVDKSRVKILTPMVAGMTQNSKVLKARATILIPCCVTKKRF